MRRGKIPSSVPRKREEKPIHLSIFRKRRDRAGSALVERKKKRM